MSIPQTYFDLTFEKMDYSEKSLPKGDYESCLFMNCIFSNAHLADINFSDCEFRDCDLSLGNLNNASIRDVTFKGCKLLGIQFGKCNSFIFSPHFENCNLNHSSFYKLQAKKIRFSNCSLLETDFTEADMSTSVFDNCNLAGAVFEYSILEKVDFRSASNYMINPETNRIKKAKFSASGIAGLLYQHDIEIEY
jgi:fluoroquinolone resistance protein